MARKEIRFYAISNISQAIEKDALYAVKGNADSTFKLYVTDLDGNLVPLLANGSGGIVDVISSNNTISITGTNIKDLTISSTLQAIINSALQSGDNISELINDAGYITIADVPTSVTKTSELINDGENGVDKFITSADIPSPTFTTDFPYNFGAGKSLGILTGSGVYPTIGKTQEQFLREIANDYIPPAFSSFTISGQPTTVEVGTTLSGSRTFNWGISLNNGIVPTIDIYDNTAGATLLASTPNDGTQSQVITTIQLNSNGATQSWKGIGNNSNGANINSGNFIVTSLYNRFWGAVATLPASSIDGTANRVYANLLSKAIKTNGTNTFTLTTGATSNKFIVLLPPGITITSVIDTGNLDLNLTSDYILSTIVIKDAGGTDRNYNQYLFNPAGAYSTSTNHVITTN